MSNLRMTVKIWPTLKGQSWYTLPTKPAQCPLFPQTYKASSFILGFGDELTL